MDCYACDQGATQRCSRCGNPYCRDHGDDLCARCLDPINAAPSSTVFRASLLALLFGSVLALWLLVRPPSLPGESSAVIQPPTSPTPTPVSTPGPLSPTPPPIATPTPSPTPQPTPTPTPGPIEYTVVAGDSWFGIAEAFGVDATELAAANGLTLDDLLRPGDVLIIPRTAPEPSPSPTLTPEPAAEGPVEYTVVPGDTWFGIAEAFGVDAAELAAVNGLTLDDLLRPGDVLTIPQS